MATNENPFWIETPPLAIVSNCFGWREHQHGQSPRNYCKQYFFFISVNAFEATMGGMLLALAKKATNMKWLDSFQSYLQYRTPYSCQFIMNFPLTLLISNQMAKLMVMKWQVHKMVSTNSVIYILSNILSSVLSWVCQTTCCKCYPQNITIYCLLWWNNKIAQCVCTLYVCQCQCQWIVLIFCVHNIVYAGPERERERE